jgi:hypothetical protein
MRSKGMRGEQKDRQGDDSTVQGGSGARTWQLGWVVQESKPSLSRKVASEKFLESSKREHAPMSEACPRVPGAMEEIGGPAPQSLYASPIFAEHPI